VLNAVFRELVCVGGGEDDISLDLGVYDLRGYILVREAFNELSVNILIPASTNLFAALTERPGGI
jgi:hypothetical protein